MFSIFLQILSRFSKKERWTFATAFLIFVASLTSGAILLIKNNTEVFATQGGDYTEGVVGQPLFINPILAQASGPDSDLIQLIFPSIEEMLDNYQTSLDRKIIDIRIKGDIKWEDGQTITTDDIIYTVGAIQDPLSGSPSASSWKGVQVERVSEREIRFLLPQDYAFFENTLLNLRVAPQHLLKGIPPSNLKFSDFNLNPIGGGKFKITEFEKRRDGFISQFVFSKNERYFGNRPYLDALTIKFYSHEESLIEAYDAGEINGFFLADYSGLEKISSNFEIFKIQTPRYYAVFFNPNENEVLKNKNIRLALDMATDKEKIIREILNNDAFLIKGPITFEKSTEEIARRFSPENAKALLESSGWRLNSSGIRERVDPSGTERLEITLTVYPLQSLVKAANIIKEEWENIGVKTNIIIGPDDEFSEEVIRPRNYQALLFGNIYGRNIDPFSFWHSSQKLYPGLNLSLYGNATADSLIDSVRTDFNESSRQIKLEQLESLISNDQPAIFLYSPYYLYINEGNLKGLDEEFLSLMSDRFKNVEKWYVKTIRKFI